MPLPLIMTDTKKDIFTLKEIYKIMFKAGDVSKYMQFEYNNHNQLQDMRITTMRAAAERNADRLRKQYEPLINEDIKVLESEQWRLHENCTKEYTEWLE